MPKTSTDKSIPPPLRALGGWLDAEWFCASILSEDEVVGITLPKLPGIRKQTFRLVERSVSDDAARQSMPRNAVKSVAAGIGRILDGIGVRRAASFRKPTFFFEAPAALYFAEIPALNLKVRAADALRRELIGQALRACVVRHDGRHVTAMFWPDAEAEITAFVIAADPPFALHPQFEAADASHAGAARQPNVAGPDGGERKAHKAERDKLITELHGLRARIAELQQSHSALGAMETLGLDDARLRAMLLLLHPDKHANSQAATDAAKWVNGLRDMIKAEKAGAR